MRVRRDYAVFFGLVVALVVFVVLIGRRKDAAPSLLSAAPSDAWLVATVDVASLRGSTLGRSLFGAAGASRAAGLGTIADACGFDPLARVREVMVAVPEGGERGEFGVAFSGDFPPSELTRCAEKVIAARGGHAIESTRGSFTVLGAGAGASSPAEIAVRRGGPFLVGRAAWLDAMIDAVDGHGDRDDRARSAHATLRRTLTEGSLTEGAPPPVIVATAVLPKALRERIEREIQIEPGTAADRSLRGVLAVEALGLSVAAAGGASTEIRAEIACETAEACAGVRDLIERKRRAFDEELGVRVVGLAPLLDGLTLQTRGSALSIAAHAPTTQLAEAVDRLAVAAGPSAREKADDSVDAGASGAAEGGAHEGADGARP